MLTWIRSFVEQINFANQLLAAFRHDIDLAEQRLDAFQQKVDKAMSDLKTFKDLLAAVDAETTRVAAKIDELLAQLEAGGLTPAEEAEVLAGLHAVSDRLKTVGADPQEPIPPVEEPPTS